MDPRLLEFCRCPICKGELVRAGGLCCERCGTTFPILGTIPCLLAQPELKLARFRAECAQYVELTSQSAASIREQLGQFALLQATRQRLERLLAATGDNTERVVSLLSAAGLAPDRASSPTGDGDFSLVEYYDHILRDWSVECHESTENVRSFQLIQETIDGDPALGRTLVLGAGACRLAYDLERRCAADFVVALDINPLLLLAAERISCGDGLRLYEFPAVPTAFDSVCVERELRPPSGRSERLFFVLGDAFAAPFENGGFDTVVTPWFIDIVASDLRETLGLIHRLLAPSGRWLHYGPLSYPRDRMAGQRYTVDEFLELSILAGFELTVPRLAEVPLLESTANARKRSERVVAFAGRKIAVPAAEAPNDVPAWLLFSHLPIPRFEGLDGYRAEHPVLGYVARQIDGRRTLSDIATGMITTKGATPNTALEGTRALLSLLYQAVTRGG